jgi:hypothetical protein
MPPIEENMQAAATARNRNNGISRVWGRVFVAEKTLSIGIAERKYQTHSPQLSWL